MGDVAVGGKAVIRLRSMSPASGVLLLGHPGLAEAFQEAFALRQKNRIIALGPDTEAVNGEVWIERKPGLGLRPRLL